MAQDLVPSAQVAEPQVPDVSLSLHLTGDLEQPASARGRRAGAVLSRVSSSEPGLRSQPAVPYGEERRPASTVAGMGTGHLAKTARP